MSDSVIPSRDLSWSRRGVATRLFLTCWLIYSLHFATNIVRDIYLALAIGDHLSFRVDEYAGLHPDLFEHPGHGWHTGANPGISLIGAAPYALARPLIDRVVAHVNASRQTTGQQPPDYHSPWPMAREFFEKAWRRGYDIKFALAAFVMQSFGMAPISAGGVVLMFLYLSEITGSRRQSLALALVYAFATPVFFRTGYLNHNLVLGHIAFAAFFLLRPRHAPPSQRRYFAAGLLAGSCILVDYSGAFLAFPLGIFVLWRARSSATDWLRPLIAFAVGAIGPILLLWFYQWRSFGHPFYPPQHWMPPLEWIDEQGFRGVRGPQWRWAWRLWLDLAYGLIPSCPLFLLWFRPGPMFRRVDRPHALLAYGSVALVWLFLSGVDYIAIQADTGVRYMAAVFPLLFLPAAFCLVEMRRLYASLWALASLVVNWSLAMSRDVERGRGVLDPLLDIFVGGFRLPALTTLSRLPGLFPALDPAGVSPLPLFALCGALLYLLWRRWPDAIAD
ncbi:MAG: hypothetical protein GC160_19595 [Acidobacteria bacterium]|nr:hypothetical protein [Acidobacteriota bacterium]